MYQRKQHHDGGYQARGRGGGNRGDYRGGRGGRHYVRGGIRQKQEGHQEMTYQPKAPASRVDDQPNYQQKDTNVEEQEMPQIHENQYQQEENFHEQRVNNFMEENNDSDPANSQMPQNQQSAYQPVYNQDQYNQGKPNEYQNQDYSQNQYMPQMVDHEAQQQQQMYQEQLRLQQQQYMERVEAQNYAQRMMIPPHLQRYDPLQPNATYDSISGQPVQQQFIPQQMNYVPQQNDFDGQQHQQQMHHMDQFNNQQQNYQYNNMQQDGYQNNEVQYQQPEQQQEAGSFQPSSMSLGATPFQPFAAQEEQAADQRQNYDGGEQPRQRHQERDQRPDQKQYDRGNNRLQYRQKQPKEEQKAQPPANTTKRGKQQYMIVPKGQAPPREEQAPYVSKRDERDYQRKGEYHQERQYERRDKRPQPNNETFYRNAPREEKRPTYDDRRERERANVDEEGDRMTGDIPRYNSSQFDYNYDKEKQERQGGPSGNYKQNNRGGNRNYGKRGGAGQDQHPDDRYYQKKQPHDQRDYRDDRRGGQGYDDYQQYDQRDHGDMRADDYEYLYGGRGPYEKYDSYYDYRPDYDERQKELDYFDDYDRYYDDEYDTEEDRQKDRRPKDDSYRPSNHRQVREENTNQRGTNQPRDAPRGRGNKQRHVKDQRGDREKNYDNKNFEHYERKQPYEKRNYRDDYQKPDYKNREYNNDYKNKEYKNKREKFDNRNEKGKFSRPEREQYQKKGQNEAPPKEEKKREDSPIQYEFYSDDEPTETEDKKFDDFGEDEFKWDQEKEYEEDKDNDDYSTYAGSSTSNRSGANLNQISRKFYQMGPQTESVKNPCTVMMVAEKPSIALSITEALCGKNYSKRTGPAKGIPIYTFKGHFKGYSANFKVTSVAGHVYNRDFPLEFQNRAKDPVSLFDAPTIRKCDGRARPVAQHLQMVSTNCDFVALWLDCDKEGENICFEVLDICKKNIPKSKTLQRVYRAKFSSIAKKDIVTAFEGLSHEPNYNEALSVDARQVLDLKIGVAFSRFQTNKLVNSIRRAGIRMLTYGPCQTPTLTFCVDQSEKIKKFVAEPFWRVLADIQDPDTGQLHKVKWCRGKIFDKSAVHAIHARLNRCYGSKEAEVISVKTAQVKQQRPQGLNTIKLLKVGSQSFGLSAHETMKIAEHLYLRGYTTYPRTESTTFSPNFNFKEVLLSLKDHDEYGEYASDLLKNGMNKPRKGVDAGDHPPITPVKSANGELHGAELRVYDYITSNFLACISQDATYDAVRTEFMIGDEKFKMKGQILLDPGFIEIQPWQRHEDKEIPLFEVASIIDVKGTHIGEGRTEPPTYLTEADLISQMEKHGIGTDASIPTHIQNIIDRNYVTIQDPGRKLVPTALGNALVKGYCEIDPELALPQVRSNIEKSCELIAKGKADFNQVINHVLKVFKAKFVHFKLSVGLMERLLNIMLNVQTTEMLQMSLAYKIPMKHESKDQAINFCVKCFKGHFVIQYHNKKGWGLKCDTCHFAARLCEGAARVKRVDDEEKKCLECGSFSANVVYKENSPFPGGQESHTGCLLCDPWLRATIRYYQKTIQLLTPAEEAEKLRQKEEKKRLKEANKMNKPQNQQNQDQDTKKKKNKNPKKGPVDLLTDQEKMNLFMQKFK